MLLKKPSMISASPSDGAFSYVFVSVVGSFLAELNAASNGLDATDAQATHATGKFSNGRQI